MFSQRWYLPGTRPGDTIIEIVTVASRKSAHVNITDYQKAKAETVDAIGEAFRDASYPGDDHLVEKSKMGFNFEQNDIEQALRQKKWRDLDLATLKQSSKYFLTPEAFVYYLPAYLIVSIIHFKEADVIPVDCLMTIDPGLAVKSNWLPKLERIKSLMSSPKRMAIRAYVEFMRDYHSRELDGYDFDIQRILDYWI